MKANAFVNDSFLSEAYLEGMKTGLSESEVGVISPPSEAYLEGMKTRPLCGRKACNGSPKPTSKE